MEEGIESIGEKPGYWKAIVVIIIIIILIISSYFLFFYTSKSQTLKQFQENQKNCKKHPILMIHKI